MADPQQLLNDYIATYQRDGGADPRPYLAKVEGVDRRELQALIEAYLERAPRATWDPDAFEGSLAERAIATAAGEEGWPELLPRLRDEAKLKRATVVERLASALGFPSQEERVAAYYHQMEQGLLQARGVSTKVLEALASILGTTAKALRQAGEAAPGPQRAGGEVFARGGAPVGMASPGTLDAEAEVRAELAQPDELDRLFIGGD